MPRNIDSWLSQFEEGDITYMELFEKIALHLAAARDEIGPILSTLRGHANPDVQFLAQALTKSLVLPDEPGSLFPMTTDQGMAPSDSKK
jgi:hypothetical protein